MLTNLPIRPRSLNSTTPVTLANRVSSLPHPTLAPGFSLVPRWRTMMLPPGTNWPPTISIVELHHARDLGEQGIVLAPSDVGARLQFGAPLAHDDAAARHQLAAEDLDAQPLRIRIAPVFRTA